MRGSGAPGLSGNPYRSLSKPLPREQPRPVMRGCDSASPPEPAAAMRVAANGYPVSKTDLQENAFWSVLFVKHPPQNGSLWGKHRGDIQPYASRRRLFVNLSTEDTSTNRGLQENAILQPDTFQKPIICRPLREVRLSGEKIPVWARNWRRGASHHRAEVSPERIAHQRLLSRLLSS